MNFSKHSLWAFGALSLMSLTACEKEIISEESTNSQSTPPNSSLAIMTRSGGTDGVVSYPITVYVMNNLGTCVDQKVLSSADDDLVFQLEAQKYDVYAIGGATTEAYNLPSQSDAAKDSEISLKEGATHGDLMSAKNSVELEQGEEGSIVLSMSRKVMKVNSVEIKDIPAEVTNVSITIGPLQEALLLDGTYIDGSDIQGINLTRQSDGTTWKNAEAVNLLPANGDATVTVKLTTEEGTKSISYICPTMLEANHEINITGTYVPAASLFVTLNGTITGASWEAPIDINFTFNEEGSQTTGNGGNSGGNEDGVEPGTAPAIKTWYKDCYAIMSADDETGNYTIVTFMHRNEVSGLYTSGMTEAELEAAINESLSSSAFEVNDVTGWRLPTLAEANAFQWGAFNTAATDHGGVTIDPNNYHFYKEDNHLYCFTSNVKDRAYTYGRALRPVTTLKFHKQ